MMDHQHTKLPQIGYGTNPYRTPSIMPSAASYCKQLETFWRKQMKEIEEAGDFKSHSLPLARIKKIMKADEDVKMISAEAPVVFAKACEMFILEITLRSWMHTEENKRRTLQKNDIAAAIGRTDIFDFLVDIVPRNDYKDDDGVLVIPRPLLGSTSALVDNAPLPPLSSYYYVSQPSPSGGISGGYMSPSLPLPLPLPHPQQVWPKARLHPPPHTAT